MSFAKSLFVSALAATTISFASSTEHTPDSEYTDLSDFLSRIVGGTTAELGEYPYYTQMNGCGGSLIAPRVVLTAAHCNGSGRNNVVVGAYEYYSADTEGAHRRTCDEWIASPDYQSVNSLDNDYALCLLNEPVDIDDDDTKFELNFNDAVPVSGDPLWAIGLGRLQWNGGVPDYLQHVEVPYITNDKCDDAYGSTIRDNMLCAGVDEGGLDSCQGDSGGPIVQIIENADGTKTHVQMGVVSFGYRCAYPGAPGVYARVSSAETWIKEQVCDDWGVDASFCPGAETPPPTANPTANPTAAPTIGIDSSKCEGWCSKNAQPWSSKCDWTACNGCSACDDEQPPPPPQENCERWCSKNAKPWSRKCSWTACNGCSACDDRRNLKSHVRGGVQRT